MSTAASAAGANAPRVHVLMRSVLIALAPGIAVFAFFFGLGVIANIAIAVAACVALEAAVLRLRGRALGPVLTDYSAVLTGTLLALSLPPAAPWWLAVLGALFAMLLGKHVYGGLGHNPFNPAMVGLAVLLISFPAQMSAMSAWPAPQLPWSGADAISAATPLDHLRTQLGLGRTLGEIGGDPMAGMLAGQGWEWLALAWLGGGLWLMRRGTIRWQIPVGVLGGLALPALAFWALDPDRFASPLFHALSGATMLGAFFIATDPVTAATSPRGRLVYGAGIGLLTWVIRTFGDYPDGIAFAVLLMNLCAPTIDRYSVPAHYGAGGKS